MDILVKFNKIEDLRVGMFISSDILSDKTGEVLVSAGTILDAFSLQKLYIHFCAPFRYDKQLPDGSGDVLRSIQDNRQILSCIGYLQRYDLCTYSHSMNVAMLCSSLGKWLGYSETEASNLIRSGILHDIGKTEIDINILNKEGKLTEGERNIIQSHAKRGYEVLNEQPLDEDLRLPAIQHHERVDGRGYPKGLEWDDINEFSRIVAICDIYEAMTSDRPYRLGRSPFLVIKQMEADYFGCLDSTILKLFLTNMAYCYLSSPVTLASGRKGEIVHIHPSNISSPIVRVSQDVFVDLAKETEDHIVSVK